MDKMNINNLLTVEDLINLGKPDSNQKFTDFHIDILKTYACKNNYDAKELEARYKKYILDEFDKLGQPTDVYDNAPKFTSEFNKYENLHFNLLIKEENGKYRASYSKHDFFAELVTEHLYYLRDYLMEDDAIYREVSDTLDEESIEKFFKSVKKLDKQEFQALIAETLRNNFLASIKNLDGEEFKERVIEELRKIKIYYINFIQKVEATIDHGEALFVNRNSNSRLSANDAVSMYRANRKVVNWYIRHMDEVLEFLDGDYPHEVIEAMDKDRFILLNCLSVDKDTVSKLVAVELNNEKPESIDTKLLMDLANYMNNYLLLVKYIKDEHNSSYNEYAVFNDDKLGMVTAGSNFIESCLKQILVDYIDSNELKYNNPEELLKNVAPDTWRKLRNKKIAENITVKFDMIVPGRKDNYIIDRSVSRVYSKSKIRQAQIDEDYRKLEDKMDYYKQKEEEGQIALNLVGINNFVGYFAKFMKNGCVVLDKYYTYGKDRRGKEKEMPAHNEGIYIMNYKEFADLCRCNKQELIDEVRDNNPDIIRKYHSDNWRKNVDKIINGPGFGGLDYDLLDNIVKCLK